MIFNTPFICDWGAIMRLKQEQIDKNNQKENNNFKPHNYRVCEKLLVSDQKANKCKDLYKGT